MVSIQITPGKGHVVSVNATSEEGADFTCSSSGGVEINCDPICIQIDEETFRGFIARYNNIRKCGLSDDHEVSVVLAALRLLQVYLEDGFSFEKANEAIAIADGYLPNHDYTRHKFIDDLCEKINVV